MHYHYHPDGTVPAYGVVWVFGSNLAGRHGAGAAKVAQDQFGALSGVGVGFRGYSYAIPTKDGRGGGSLRAMRQLLPLEMIEQYVWTFIDFAKANPKREFFVTRVGCGLAGYSDEQMAPLFLGSPVNCSFAREWSPYLERVENVYF